MLNADQARRLKEAGLSAYNHNLDTSREFYPSVSSLPLFLVYIYQVITTRSYDERLATLQAVRDAGISVCSGGILGLGEEDEDRVGLIHEVSRLAIHLVKDRQADIHQTPPAPRVFPRQHARTYTRHPTRGQQSEHEMTNIRSFSPACISPHRSSHHCNSPYSPSQNHHSARRWSTHVLRD